MKNPFEKYSSGAEDATPRYLVKTDVVFV